MSFSSPIQCARSARPATTELTKVLVAATLFSTPALRSTVKSAAAARGEPAVLVSAMVKAPLWRADWAIATMSGLLPDCDTAIEAARSSFSVRP